MRVLVCGGRNYKDEVRVFAVLDRLHHEHGVTAVIHGGASGADSFATMWCVRGLKQASYPDRPFLCSLSVYGAEWKKHGESAGPIRNQRMLDNGRPDLVVAFPGGRGTADMVRRARLARIEVLIVDDSV